MAKKMSKAHKMALAKGREQARAVRDYLESLEEDRKPGRRLSRGELEAKVHELEAKVATEADPTKRVELIQRRLDYQDRLATHQDMPDLTDLEKAFAAAAKEYSERKGITYSAWREVGVPAAVLRDAGVPRTRRTAA